MIATALTLVVASAAAAQTSPQAPSSAGTSAQTASGNQTTSGTSQTPSQTPSTMTSTEVHTRPATTTFMGDTGLWNVPTGEVLPAKRWSISAYRVNFDDNQGFTDVSNWPFTFGYGIADRAELFASWVLVNRIDRDIRPLFIPAIPQAGGVVPDNPLMNTTWSGSNLGDLWIGVKFNLASQYHQKPFAFALRPMIKLATGDDAKGASTGKTDFIFDAVLSKEINERVEVSGYGGFITRGAPDLVEETNGFRYGFGVGVPSRKSLRFTAELYGEKYSKSTLLQNQQLLGTDGSFINPGFESEIKSPVNIDLGLTWQATGGFFAGFGWTWRPNMDSRDNFLAQYENGAGDRMDIVGRIGYHPGVRIYVPPPPPPPVAAPPPAPEHTLSVRASCNPCSVEVGKTSTVDSVVTDSIGCSVTYEWSAPAGTFTNGRQKSTPWTAPNQEGTVPVTVRVTCPTDGKTASDTVNIQVTRPPAAAPIVFEDVHFDFDRYSLRPEAVRTLDEAVAVLQKDSTINVLIEGHTCNIGTAEYNLALGERRANSVRDYLVSRGISASRFRTVSYGEERPKYDNSREETRRLNRRAALTVTLQR